ASLLKTLQGQPGSTPSATSTSAKPLETATKSGVTSGAQDGGITIQAVKAKYEESIKPLVKPLYDANPDRQADIAEAVKSLNEKFQSGTTDEAKKALVSLASLLKSLQGRPGSTPTSTPQGTATSTPQDSPVTKTETPSKPIVTPPITAGQSGGSPVGAEKSVA